jgi:hypothetical protein
LVPIYNILIRIEEEKRKILPVGARSTSWSRVRHFPPALTILALAVSVNLRAATVILGTSRSLISSVTVPTTTAILSLQPLTCEMTPRFSKSLSRLPLLAEVLNEAGKGQRGSVHLGSDESSHDGLSEN